MTEIAAVVAVVIALAALWLASTAHSHVENTFKKYSNSLNKQIRDAQAEVFARADRLEKDMKELQNDVAKLESHSREHSEKINTLIQRTTVVEHDLKSLIEAIPPQYLRTPVKKRAEG